MNDTTTTGRFDREVGWGGRHDGRTALALLVATGLMALAGCSRKQADADKTAAEAELPAVAVQSAVPTTQGATSSAVDPSDSRGEPTGPMRFGETRSFGAEGGAASFLVEGWSAPEQLMTWSSAKSATIGVPVTCEGSAVRLRLQAHPFTVPPQLPAQKIVLTTNGGNRTTWELEKSTYLNIPVPASAVASGRIELRFQFPDAASPASYGLSSDGRQLALAVYGIGVEAMPVLVPPYQIAFGPKGPEQSYLFEGWFPPEEDGVWTSERRAVVVVPLPPAQAFKAVRVTFIPFVAKGQSHFQEVRLSVNGGAPMRWVTNVGMTVEYAMPAGGTPDGLCRLEFEVPGASERGIKISTIEFALAGP